MIGSLRDTDKGGLTKDAYTQFKGNELVVAAANADRAAMIDKAKSKVSKANMSANVR